jgi:ribosome-binding ATPase YchF (GTP1/OBG family)
LNEEEAFLFSEMQFLTAKPFLYVANVAENEAGGFDESGAKKKIGSKTMKNWWRFLRKSNRNFLDYRMKKHKSF